MTSTPSIIQLKTNFFSDLEKVKTERELQELRDAYLGRKRGALVALLKSISSAPIDTRPSLGKQANELKLEIDTALSDRRKNISKQTDSFNQIDVTLAGRPVELGRRHPLLFSENNSNQFSLALASRYYTVLKLRTTIIILKPSTCPPNILPEICRIRYT